MKLQKIPLIVKVVSLYFVLAILCVAFIHISNSWSYRQAAHAINIVRVQTEEKPESPVSGHPTHLNIDRLNISLAVKDGHFNEQSGEWTLSRDSAHFANTTKQPNSSAGNTLIYGHNSRPVFSQTKHLIEGDLLTITTDTGFKLRYRYTGDSIVNPSDTTILTSNSKAPTLTLLTCNGWFNENRRLMFFDFIGVAS